MTAMTSLSYYTGIITLTFIAFPTLAQAQNSFSPGQKALALFNKYKPVIEKKNNAIVDDPKVTTGDINGDGKDDCIISFVMTSKDGGNAIIGADAAIYLNTGTDMKVVGTFPGFKFCFYPDHIRNQVIYAKEYECKPPYLHIIREREFIYKGGRIVLIH
jgi:hypothetical protein